MQMRICSSSRKRYLVLVKSVDEFISKVRSILGVENDFRCVLEEDGSEIVSDVLEDIFKANEKIGAIMVLQDGEQWTPVADNLSATVSLPSVSALPVLPTRFKQEEQSPAPETATDKKVCTVSLPSMSARPVLPTLIMQEEKEEEEQSPAHERAIDKKFDNVRSVLQMNAKGQKVLAEYDRHRTLSSESRQILVKVLVDQLVEDCGLYPSGEQKMQLGLAIVTAFPGLKDAAGVTGYDYFFTMSNGQTGYIQDRLKRIRRLLAPELQQRPRKKTRENNTSLRQISDGCNLPPGEQISTELADVEIDRLVLDCKCANPSADRSIILDAMAKTAAARQQWIRRENPSITEVLDKYPRLEDLPLDLLDIDFRLLFPNAVNNFVADFPGWTKGIIAAARLSRKTDIVELLREYDTEEHGPDLTPRDHMYALLALLRLLPSSNTRQKAKVSSIELEQSLISFKPKQTNLDLFLSQKTQKQPFLLCIGSKEEPIIFYLILDRRAICLGVCGVLRAVDALFKSHYVYWVGYAKPIVFFMEFLQKLLFRIECTKLSSRVRELHSSIVTLTDRKVCNQNENC